MVIPIISDIISNIWFFQTESVVALFKEISIIILILFVVDFILAVVLDQVLMRSKYHIPIGLTLWPIFVVILTYLFYSFGGLLGFNFYQFEFNNLLGYAIKHWWVFVVFWIMTLFGNIPYSLGKLTKNEKVMNFFGTFFTPIHEEFFFRYLGINTIYVLTNSIEIAIIFSSIGFTLIHLPNKSGDKWGGPVKINATLFMGFALGIIAVKYGFIFAIAIHILNNLLAFYVLPKIFKDEQI